MELVYGFVISFLAVFIEGLGKTFILPAEYIYLFI
jgi:hypothetical protein